MNPQFPVPFSLSVLFVCVPAYFGAVEQTLFIDLAKRHSANGQQFGEVEGVQNLLTITKGMKERRRWGQTATEDHSSELNKLKETVLQLDKLFTYRFDQLSKRVEWVEANQRNLMKETNLLETNEHKRIRLFAKALKDWTEAKNLCNKMDGDSLLEIKSKEEKRRISELLKDTDRAIWWVGVQTTPSPQRLPYEYSGQSREGNVNGLERSQESEYARPSP
ncbi:hypothetical protein GPALN_003741 [Globodera pallida]|nr:hypothetical protein GPALN_003741 [Globodera pallida]